MSELKVVFTVLCSSSSLYYFYCGLLFIPFCTLLLSLYHTSAVDLTTVLAVGWDSWEGRREQACIRRM